MGTLNGRSRGGGDRRVRWNEAVPGVEKEGSEAGEGAERAGEKREVGSVIRGAGWRTSQDPWMGWLGGERLLVLLDVVIVRALLFEGHGLSAKAFFSALCLPVHGGSIVSGFGLDGFN